jgi:hypothetical protein
MMSLSRESTLGWDTIGVGASSLCVIHCIATPILLAFSPALADFLPGTETVHRTLAYLLTAVGLFAFRSGYNVHGRKYVLLLLLAGIVGITVGAYGGFWLPSPLWEHGITFAGSGFLITAHSINRTLCRKCQKCRRKIK